MAASRAFVIHRQRSHQPQQSHHAECSMAKGFKTIIYPVKDITKAKAVFGRLAGSTPEMDQPYYVQYNVDGQQIGLDPNGHAQGFTGPINYWSVDDIKRS